MFFKNSKIPSGETINLLSKSSPQISLCFNSKLLKRDDPFQETNFSILLSRGNKKIQKSYYKS